MLPTHPMAFTRKQLTPHNSLLFLRARFTGTILLESGMFQLQYIFMLPQFLTNLKDRLWSGKAALVENFNFPVKLLLSFPKKVLGACRIIQPVDRSLGLERRDGET